MANKSKNAKLRETADKLKAELQAEHREKMHAALKDAEAAADEALSIKTGTADIYFTCTNCGRCCDTTIPLLFKEVLTHSTRFIIETQIIGIRVPEASTEADRQELQAHLASIFVQGKEQSFFLGAVPLVTDFGNRCAQWDEALPGCTLGPCAPAYCNLTPFDMSMPEKMQGKPIVGFIMKGFSPSDEDRYLCNFSKTREDGSQNIKIYSKSDIVDDAMRLLFKEVQGIQQSERDLVTRTLPLALSFANTSPAAIVSSLQRAGKQTYSLSQTTSILPLAIGLVESGTLTPAEGDLLIRNQIEVLQRKIDGAVLAKVKEHRAKTAYYRELLRLYQEFMR